MHLTHASLGGLAQKASPVHIWRASSGRLFRLPNSPFNTAYKINTPDGIVIINGDQLTKIIVAPRAEGGWKVTFYLADGSLYWVESNEWTEAFVQNTLGDTAFP